MKATYFKLVEVPKDEIKIGEPHIIVATKTEPSESISTFREAKVDWALHLCEGSAAIINTGGLIRLVQSKA